MAGGVPPYLPPILALLCAVVAGLTSFGDAILFHVLWGLCSAAGWLPGGRRETLTLAVLYLSFMPIANLPLLLYVSRALLKKCAVYGVVMAVTGIAMVNVGGYLLFYGDLTALKLAIGTFFVVFASARMLSSVASLGRQRQSLLAAAAPCLVTVDCETETVNPTAFDLETQQYTSNGSSSNPPLSSSSSHSVDSAVLSVQTGNGVVDECPGTSADCTDSCTRNGTPGMQHSEPLASVCAAPDSDLGESTAATGLQLRACTVVAIDATGEVQTVHRNEGGSSGASLTATTTSMAHAADVAVPATTCSSSGGGAPALVAWHGIQPISPTWNVKATLGLLFCTGIASGLLGGLFGTGGPPQMIAFSILKVDKDVLRAVSTVYGVLELGMRLYNFTASDQSSLEAGDWPIFVGIIVASWIGFTFGTFCRTKVNTETIIRLLYCLVFASSAILLGALDSVTVGVVFLLLAALLGGCIACLYFRPPFVDACLSRLSLLRLPSAALRNASCAATCCKREAHELQRPAPCVAASHDRMDQCA